MAIHSPRSTRSFSWTAESRPDILDFDGCRGKFRLHRTQESIVLLRMPRVDQRIDRVLDLAAETNPAHFGIAMMGDDQQGAPAVAIRPRDNVRAGEGDGANLVRVQPGDKDIERFAGKGAKMQVRIAAGWRLPPVQGKHPLQIGKRIGTPRPVNHPEITSDQSDKRHGRWRRPRSRTQTFTNPMPKRVPRSARRIQQYTGRPGIGGRRASIQGR